MKLKYNSLLYMKAVINIKIFMYSTLSATIKFNSWCPGTRYVPLFSLSLFKASVRKALN